ncbi:hypothetical protein NBRC10512_006515 [Rhodotorula toruloides]|uniref:RHTO0S01e03906g1_1 n=2 Tax=Rhodotorula toruloides TaxID=5286 RepID=A0A061AJZ6_RHOTO|nr:2-hydroxyacid dehydrogenase [Rhodotorula toruloides NP11]EMS21867.1 2-hydroxyacid dehydrogenase [Rhodotorula toruloides NP11]KAJ8292180.1 putative 2-hydroxyacid dehydrogenase [Rhodotorula toruloides]CDR35642.1 RHTO0S01e03906g1_1 [Rhodotorula toruloides]
MAATTHNEACPAMETVLILHSLAPLSLLDDLRSTFRTVKYHPIQTRDGSISPTHPTAEDYATADAIFAFSVPDELQNPAQTPRLKLFQVCSSGYSQVEQHPFYKAAKEAGGAGIAWTNCAGIQTTTIAEHVIGTVIMLLHKIHFLYWAQRAEQRWVSPREIGGFNIQDVGSLKVGVIGYGHIGREVARLFHAFGSTVYALTRDGAPTPEKGYTLPGTGDPSGSLPTKYYATSPYSSILSFFSACDVVVNVLPDTPRTHRTISTDEFKAMKGDAIYVNIGRGTTTDQEVLVEALRAKKEEGEAEDATGTLRIGAASLDVTDPEPLPSSHPLYTLPNVILTPHVSGLSKDYWRCALNVLKLNAEKLGRGEEAVNVWSAAREGVKGQ